jgi:hypothetical protein
MDNYLIDKANKRRRVLKKIENLKNKATNRIKNLIVSAEVVASEVKAGFKTVGNLLVRNPKYALLAISIPGGAISLSSCKKECKITSCPAGQELVTNDDGSCGCKDKPKDPNSCAEEQKAYDEAKNNLDTKEGEFRKDVDSCLYFYGDQLPPGLKNSIKANMKPDATTLDSLTVYEAACLVVAEQNRTDVMKGVIRTKQNAQATNLVIPNLQKIAAERLEALTGCKFVNGL